ncbi:MAG: UvrD-helicase domain-containing protein [Oscillospiraceae bacterium]|nr:UvrD-helicase domain-containing protein [Oscillospiraceae bacterium]
MSENTAEKKPPTPEQENAIAAKINSPTIVSAAAGTGKTTMLVERVLRLISDCENPVRADSLVIITFTVNATQHLREKLSSALSERIEALDNKPENIRQRDYLIEQSVRLRNASISTINSFCLGIIKDNIEKFDLPVNITIADETKAASLQWTAINLTKQDFYADNIFDSEERNLLFYSFNFENDDALFEQVISAANTLSSYSDSEKWLNDSIKSYDSIDALEKTYMPVFAEYIGERYEKALYYEDLLDRVFNEYRQEYNGLPDKETKKAKEDKEKKLSVMNQMSEFLSRLSMLSASLKEFADSPSLGALEKLTLFAQQFSIPKFDQTDRNNPLKKAFVNGKNSIQSIIDDISDINVSRSEEEHNLEHNRAVISAFVKLIRIYRGYFSEIKRAQGYVDFSDCELLLLEKLRNDEDFCELLSSRFSCVIVDEFQDCNDVQAEIFRLIGKERQFYVGDIKQSIYAFRGGNPEIMAKLCKGEQDFNELPLTKNFRSRQPVIDTVNDAFFGLMTEKYGGVEYNKDTRLVYGAEYPDAEDNSVYASEIYSLSREISQEEFVAKRIYELMHDESFMITKNKKLCRPNYSDFAILLRNKGKISNYRSALMKYGISSAAPHGKNILDSEEAAMLIKYLKVIDNPLRDSELLHILMSPLYRFTADEIARLRLGILGFPDEMSDENEASVISSCFKNYALYECLKFCATEYGKRGDYGLSEAKKKAEECEKALLEKGIKRTLSSKALAAYNNITSFRRFMNNSSIVDLIRKVCADTDIYSVVCALDESRKRVANLRRFEKIAEDFVLRDGGTLCDFLRFIRQIEENKRGAIEEASVPEDAANSVRIMTFHASKGLEIPVCILAELQTPYNKNDYSGNFLINHDYFFSIRFVDRKARYQASTFAHQAITLANRQKPIGEEMRLLYVAMTRAQEKLIMVGKLSKEKKEPSFISEFYEETIPFKWIWRKLTQNNYETKTITDSSDMLSAADKHSENSACVNEYDQADVEQAERADEITEKTIKELVEKKYRNEAETVMRAKYSVTEIAHRNDVMPFVLTKPSFLSKSSLKGTDIGNAYHHTMEHISLKDIQTAEDLNSAVSEAVKELCALGKITDEEKRLVKCERIAEFFSGTLGQRMLKSQRIERERSFYAELSGHDIGISDIGENTAIQGQIDMFFEESDGIVIVDYKSDTKENLIKEKDNYSLQVKIYAAVVPMLFGKPVKEIYLYSFSNGEAVKI